MATNMRTTRTLLVDTWSGWLKKKKFLKKKHKGFFLQVGSKRGVWMHEQTEKEWLSEAGGLDKTSQAK